MGNSLQREKGPLSHEHTLLHQYVEQGSQNEQCDVCRKELYGLVYACEVCKFWRHGSCAQKRMPSEINHPFHSKHELELTDGYHSANFLCEMCFCNSRGYRYHCCSCNFDVDLACASSAFNDLEGGRVRKRLKHFSHGKPLAYFKYRKTTRYYELDCSWCDKRLSDWCYGCFEGGPFGCKFFLHESCISKIPHRLQHPFHPSHPLYVQYDKRGFELSCNACKRSLPGDLTTFYACHRCCFYLHISCARLQPTLKHESHKHELTQFSQSKEGYRDCFDCNYCGQDCSARKIEEGAFYRCVQCDFNIHLKCLPAPAVAKHRYHRHFLALHPGVTEDDSGEYFCDICEEERNPKHCIYYCNKCAYIAHVECVLKELSEFEARRMKNLVKRVQQSNGNISKVKEATDDKNQLFKMQEIHLLLKEIEQEQKEMKKDKQKYYVDDNESSSSSSDDENENEHDGGSEEEEDEEEEDDDEETSEEEDDDGEEENKSETSGEEKEELEINHFSHQHFLKVSHLTDKYEYGNCNACSQDLYGTVYICETCEFPFHYGLHKACTELPQELQHPVHPDHSLTLSHEYPHSDSGLFLCDECRCFSAGFVYLCMDCGFKLDVQCATSAAPEHPKPMIKETKFIHFGHKHELVLGNLNLVYRSIACNGCALPISGLAFGCLDCLYIIHESCLTTLPKEIQHPFHPLHPLVANLVVSYKDDRKCHACKMGFSLGFLARDFIRYGCDQCEVDLHLVCANSLGKSILKSKSHIHGLYYFGADSQMFLKQFGEVNKFNFLCVTCNQRCDGPFYRCVECAINFHLKCVQVPEKINSGCHIHSFTLKDSFVEDDSEEYYCDVCEEERHPKNHVYYCEECQGCFVAHIECVLNFDEAFAGKRTLPAAIE